VRVNDRRGITTCFDLGDPKELDTWGEVEHDRHAQDKITGVILGGTGTAQVSVPTPRRFRSVSYQAEPLQNGQGCNGERLIVQADDVRLTVLVYRSGMARVDLVKTGHPRHLSQFDKPRGTP